MFDLGLVNMQWWQVLIYLLVTTHITILSVTLYLHRFSAHRALDLHPLVQHFFRFWVWFSTSMNTREWTAIHRKHHAKCETPEDPHSPQQQGIKKVFWQGVELYRAAKTPETVARYGKGTPDDWLERHLYDRYRYLGVSSLLVIDLLLMGPIGLTVWAIQMLWIPILAAGVINGVGHYWGYRNFECSDASTNVVPWGLLIGGEELHNNHHTYPNSAKFSMKPWEFDLGWQWIRLFRCLGLAKNINQGPICHQIEGKTQVDEDTALAAANNRFQIMAHYRKLVVGPLVKAERRNAEQQHKALFRRAKAIICREERLLDAQAKARLGALLEQNQVVDFVYNMHQDLQNVWAKRSANSGELAQALKDWCNRAEASGIQAFSSFAGHLRSYSTSPRVS